MDTNLEGDHPRTIFIKLGFLHSNSSEDFQRFPTNLHPIINHGSYFGFRARITDINLEEDHPRSITYQSDPIWTR